MGIKIIIESQTLNEKDDRCTRIAKRKYDVWPSAYASGAVVKCRQGKIWKDLKEEDILAMIEQEISDALEEKKQSSEDAGNLHKWFARKGEKGSKGGWVDCNAPDGDGGYKECAQGDRKKKPYCRPTPSACKTEPKKEALEIYTEIYVEDPTLDDGTIVEDLGFWDDDLMEAYYQGRKVTLNKPTRGDVKKFKVYVNSGKKDSKGRIKAKKVNFGDKNMKIKKSNPKRRKSFRARHTCDNPGPKTKARYWSCKKW